MILGKKNASSEVSLDITSLTQEQLVKKFLELQEKNKKLEQQIDIKTSEVARLNECRKEDHNNLVEVQNRIQERIKEGVEVQRLKWSDTEKKYNKEIAQLKEDIRTATEELELQKQAVKLKENEVKLAQKKAQTEAKRQLNVELEKQEAILKQREAEAEAKVQQREAEAKKSIAKSEEQVGRYEQAICFYPNAVDYAKKSYHFIELVNTALSELDHIIADYYEDSDDVNFFYVRRRLKFLEGIGGSMDFANKWAGQLSEFITNGFVSVNSELYKAIGNEDVMSSAAMQNYLYTSIFKHLIGPALILVREILALPKYVEITRQPYLTAIKSIEQEMLQLVTELGFRLYDVTLFSPMPYGDEHIECVEKNDVVLPGVNLKSGDVYEIIKYAVSFGNKEETTSVKVKE